MIIQDLQIPVMINLRLMTVDNTVGNRQNVFNLVLEVVIGERGPRTRLLVLEVKISGIQGHHKKVSLKLLIFVNLT